MSDHLRQRWRRLAVRDQVKYLILPNDPQRAHDAIRLHAHSQGLDTSSAAGDTPWSRNLLHQLTGEDAGFTVHDHLGDAPKQGFMVADVGAEEVHPLEHLAKHPEIVQDYYAKHRAAMADPKKYFGAWVSKGQVFLDVSRHHEDEDKAHEAGAANNQLAIYDLARRKSVPVRHLATAGRHHAAHLYGRSPIAFADQVNAMVRQASGYYVSPATAAQAVCEECGYNLPAHGRGCSSAPKSVPYCPDHMPAGANRPGSDDASLTCSVCGVRGYHVDLALEPKTATADHHNPLCPDFGSHAENAADRLHPGKRILNQEQAAEVDAAAEDEYRHCEGH